ncbi:MAG: signal peptidase I [Dehalococcoidales bacterium]
MELRSQNTPLKTWLIIAGIAAGLFIIFNLAIPAMPTDPFIKTYIIQPILWLAIIAVIWILPRYSPIAGLRNKTRFIRFGLMFGLCQIAFLVIGGLFSSFGQSPYSFKPISIITNLFYTGSMLAGMEISRSWLINHLARRRLFLALILVALLYTLLTIPFYRITGIKAEIESIPFIGGNLLPAFAENLLATQLALFAGPVAAIAYRGVIEIFWWFSPVLPNLPWVFKAIIGVGAPVAGMVIATGMYNNITSRHPSRKKTQEGFPAGWILTSVFAVLAIWFSVGLLPFQPALIASGSMQPTFNTGDVVIVAKMPAEKIDNGDIIIYRVSEKMDIVHRVVNIEKQGSKLYFTTRGDANEAEDPEPVLGENVIGKVMLSIPKIGWIAIRIKNLLYQ